MEPSSTAFRRATALLTTIAAISLGMCAPAVARGVAGMGRVQAVRVVPGIPVRPHTLRGEVTRGQVSHAGNPAPVDRRFPRHRLQRRAAWLSLPYAPYLIDTAQPDSQWFPNADDIGPIVLPLERPACVRPLIISIKRVRHPAPLPRVIYGHPLAC